MARPSHETSLLRNEHSLLMLQCCALFLVIAGARWWLIGRFGVDMPAWMDQWDGEWEPIYLRFFNGTLGYGDWFSAHNEHRIFFTRLLNFGLFLANGQWDPLLEMTVNVILHSFVACWLYIVFAGRRGGLFQLFWAVTLAAFFILPFDYENTLSGFQSTFYFLEGFSLIGIWLLVNERPASLRWLAGSAIGAAALVTMSSGSFAALAVLMCFAVLLLREWDTAPVFIQTVWPTLVVCVVLIAAGSLLVVKVDAHVQYRAKDLVDFIFAFYKCLSWPWITAPWFGIFAWLPYVAFLWAFVSRKLPDGRSERLLVAMGGWVLLQAAAMALARATIIGSSRYAGLLSFGLLVNVLCTVLLLSGFLSGFQRRAGQAILALWLLLNGTGVYQLGFYEGLIKDYSYRLVQRFRVARLVGTGKIMALVDPVGGADMPLREAHQLASYLSDPRLQQILPVGLRGPLVLTADNEAQPTSVTDFDLKAAAPYPWERVWRFPAGSGFSGTVEKAQNLPFVRMLVAGESDAVSVSDEENQRRFAISLPGGNSHAWTQIYAYCPGHVCRIIGSGGSGTVRISAIKEMGALSLVAMVIDWYGGYVACCGLILAVLTVVLALAARRDGDD